MKRKYIMGFMFILMLTSISTPFFAKEINHVLKNLITEEVDASEAKIVDAETTEYEVLDLEKSTPEETPLSDEEISELFGISIEDPTSFVDQSAVDYSTPGTYPVIFTTYDSLLVRFDYEVSLKVEDILPEITTTTTKITLPGGSAPIDVMTEYGVEATEITTGDLTADVVVDDSAVDYDFLALYRIYLTVSDEEGNIAKETVYLDLSEYIVLDREKFTPEETVLSDEQVAELFGMGGYESMDQSAVDYSTPGTYPVVFSSFNLASLAAVQREVQLTVEDILPEITTTKTTIELLLGSSPIDVMTAYGVEATEITTGDLTADVVVDDSAVDYDRSGLYEIYLTVEDEEGNIASKTLYLEITDYEVLDLEKFTPEETALSDEEIQDLFGISGEVDQSAVDYSTPGTYPVIFSKFNYGDLEKHDYEVQLTVEDILPEITTTKTKITLPVGSSPIDVMTAYGVEATEITTGDLTADVVVDDSSVDYNEFGLYKIFLTVEDEEGNVAKETVYLDISEYTVLDYEKFTPEETPLSDIQLKILFGYNEEVDQSAVDYSTPGTYPVVFTGISTATIASLQHEVQLTVEDILPEITTTKTTIELLLGSSPIDVMTAYGVEATEITTGDLTADVVVDDSSVDYDKTGTYPIILTVEDEEGNIASTEVTLEIKRDTTIDVDPITPEVEVNQPPVITANATATTPEETVLSDDALVTLFDATADDQGTDITADMTIDQSAVDYSTPGTYPVIFTAVDADGLETVFEGELTVEDVLPVIEAANEQLTITLGQTITDYIGEFGVEATEITTGDLTADVVVDDSSVDYDKTGTYPITLTVVDEEGNIASTEVTLEIKRDTTIDVDPITPEVEVNQPPVITANATATTPEETVLTDDALVTLFDATADDQGTDITADMTIDQSAVDYSTPGTYPVIFTVVDADGLETVFEGELTVEDVLPVIEAANEQLTITLGQTITDYIGEFGVEATEITTGDLTADVVVDDSSIDYDKTGTYPVIFIVEDEEGNTVSKEVSVVIERDATIDVDPITPEVEVNQPPVITANATATTPEETVLTDEELITLFDASADDQGTDITADMTIDQSAVDYSTPGTYPVIFTVVDEDGLETVFEGELTVEDVLPVIEAANEQLTITLGQTISDYIGEFGVEATEITTGDLTGKVDIDDSSVDYDKTGTYQVIFTVEDEEGNTVSKEVSVVIERDATTDVDPITPEVEVNQPPVITANATATTPEETVLTDEELIALFAVTATDQGTDITDGITVDQSAVEYGTPGTYPVIFTAVDEDGLETVFEGQLTVEDVLPILEVNKSNVEISNDATREDLLTLLEATATEIINGDLTPVIEFDDSAVEYGTPGTYTIYLTVMDEEGNIVEKQIVVTIDGTEVEVESEQADAESESVLATTGSKSLVLLFVLSLMIFVVLKALLKQNKFIN